MEIVIGGGGMLGLSTGYYLARAGHRVTILEAGAQLGGLATDVEVGGIRVDRFYHCILNADEHAIGLIDEVGLRDQLCMGPVKAGFHTNGKTYPMSTPVDLLRFPPLRVIDRLRLVRALLTCRRIANWQALEAVDVESWLRGLSGDRVFDTVWRPLLSAKFDGAFTRTPATYIWSRTVRMTDTRSTGGAREMAGYLIGGYRTLAERLAEKIAAMGGEVRLNAPIAEVVTDGEAVIGVRAAGEFVPADAVVLTTPLPLTARLLHGRTVSGVEGDDQRNAIEEYTRQVEGMQGYLGIICVLLMLDKPLSPYYTLYLADDELPFTAVMEATNLIDPVHVGGKHLVYLPKYLDPTSELFQMTDDEIRSWFLSSLRRIYPALRDEDIIAAPVFRAPHVEPLHPLGSFGTVPPTRTPIDGLFIGSTKHFYPRLNNCDAVTRLGAAIAEEAAALPARARVATPA